MNTQFPRRWMALALFLTLGAAVPPLHAAERGAAAAASVPASGAGHDDDAPRAKPKDKPAALLVQVTGDGKPVAHAEVRVKPAGGEPVSRFTQDDGSVSLATVAPGKANVFVIAPGWDSDRADVNLKAGEKATLAVKLKK